LLVLSGEVVLALRAAQMIEDFDGLAVRVECFASAAREGPGSKDGLSDVVLVVLGDGGEANELPGGVFLHVVFRQTALQHVVCQRIGPGNILGEQVAGEVVFVETLHDDDDDAGALAIEAAVEGVIEPFVGGGALGLGERLVGLEGIVDDEEVGATSGEHSADRGGEAHALGGGVKFGDGLTFGGETRGKELLIPVGVEERAAVEREFVGEVLGVATADDLRAGIVSEEPGREGDGGAVGFERARRHIDDEARGLDAAAGLEFGGNELDVPVRQKWRGWVEFDEAALDEGGEVVAQEGLVFVRSQW